MHGIRVLANAGISHAWAMRPVEIAEYDATWPEQFEAERQGLRLLLGDLLDDAHHIGSTSIPGLAAKPKIDIDAVLRAEDVLPQAIDLLRATDVWDYHGDPYGDGRWTLTRGRTRGIRLYLCAPGNAAHQRRIVFRDWLRGHPEDTLAYETLKRRLAAEAEGDFAFYTGGKSDFVAAIIERAMRETAEPEMPDRR